MKVLLLHQHFNIPATGGAIRSYYLARALADRGIKVVVITGWNGRQYKNETVDGIDVHYLPVPYENRFGFYKRGVAFLRYVWSSVRLAAHFKDADACYAISTPLTVGIIAMRIKAKYKIPFVFEVGDLWPDAPVQLGFVRNIVLRNILYRLERTIYKAASSVVALSTSIQSAVEHKVEGIRTHLIPNMADTDFYTPEEKDPALEEKFNVSDKFVVSYIGAVGYANGLDHFLTCAKTCAQASLPVHFLLCGAGGELPRLKNSVSEMKLVNISILPFQDRNGVKAVLNITDAAFVSYRPVPVLETGSPNKYFDALAAGKLVVVNVGGWIRREIEANQCGVFVDQKSDRAIVDVLKPFLEDREHLKRYQRSARQLAETRYSRTLLSAKFASIFQSMR